MRRRGHLLFAAAAVWGLAACGDYDVASLTFVDVNPKQPKIGDVTTVRFNATDYRGQPMAGADVNFSLLSPLNDGGVSGVLLNPLSAPTNKGDGNAQTQLVASSRVNAVIVVAQSGSKTAVSPPITFAGAYPSARNFTFQCGPIAGTGSGGMHNIRVYDPTRQLIVGEKLKCDAHVADRNGNGLAGVEVSFLAEAGTIEPTETTVTDADGNAEVLYKSSFPLPLDVSPGVYKAVPWNPSSDAVHIGDSANPVDTIAPSWMQPFEWVASPIAQRAAAFNPPFDNRTEPSRPDPVKAMTTNNSRDGLVTMIAITTGEESFFDDNGNGKFDPGKETFLDSTEPFVDSNDNGTWDPGELFIDTNGNGVWDGKNGQFDASTLIWAKERILWTGVPEGEDVDPAITPDPIVALTGNTNVIVHHCSTPGGPVEVLWADPWWNSMAQDGDSDGCSFGQASGGDGITSPVSILPLSGTAMGFEYDYPDVQDLSFLVVDATCGVDAGISYPIGFEVPIQCRLTSSPETGDVLTLPLGTVSGTIVNP